MRRKKQVPPHPGRAEPAPPVRSGAPLRGARLRGERAALRGWVHLATGIVNSAPLAMLSGQRCITLL